VDAFSGGLRVVGGVDLVSSASQVNGACWYYALRDELQKRLVDPLRGKKVKIKVKGVSPRFAEGEFLLAVVPKETKRTSAQ
jgi:hypothetical protein